ncbi:cell division protein ZapE [Candidatus Pelagibacter sp.]|nr:cell division protein ZapE [Candidatus Pelagibacter sp.]MDA9682014.1 cell division protein ZapE [Candidatus Pelagibacter sp.]MDA9682029.1 cell division protein ZapE [Candidatus Pelagibacter sp.]
MVKKLQKEFISYCNNQQLEVNSYQIDVIVRLEQYYQRNFQSYFLKLFSKKSFKKGFYLYGDVGVGKTMILNFFFDHLKEKKLRLHFNEFMLSFHNFVHEKKEKEEENIINHFIKNLKLKASLIYFDEFQVTNIVDAMILGKLFDQIFKEDIKIIVTSNTKISELYKNGLQRDQFKPFIKIMEQKSIEYELKIEDDYRKSNYNQKQRYFYPLNEETNFKINKFFRTITKNKKHSLKIINVKGRDFKIEKFYDGIVRFNFNELCDQNLGAEDYLEIIKNCKFIVLDQIPQFDDTNSNQQQRFITLLDVIYEKNIPISVTANQNLDKFSSSKLLEKPFKRTISRLYELTSID